MMPVKDVTFLAEDRILKRSTTSQDRWAQLMVAAQAGDQQSYKTLLSEVADFLRPLLRFKLKNSADAEDVLQNILLTVHRARHSFDSQYPFKPWLGTITQSRLIEFWRSKGRRYKLEVAIEDSHLENLQAEAEISSLEKSQLDRAFQSLNETQQNILVKLKVEGQSIKEVAQAMQMSESAVKVAAHRAYKVVFETVREGT